MKGSKRRFLTAWTDDGMAILRHRTDIGTGANAESVEFCSLLAHLSALRGNALKVARASATADIRPVKCIIAAQVFGAPPPR